MASHSKGIPLIGPLLTLIIGTRNERFVKKYNQHVAAINALEPAMRRLTDAELRAKTEEFRKRSRAGEKSVEMLDEVFAAAREAMDRAVGIKNIFNPRFAEAFDPSRLSPAARAMYDEAKARIETMPPAPPDGEFLGCSEAQPGWRQAELPPELYEAVRELYPESRPPFRSRPFDVQLIGGMALSQGKIAEMKTGEGKTIVAPLAAYLAAVEGVRVHVVTVNDYLVQRDRDWTFPYFHALGLTVGAIHPMHMQDEEQKRRMYRCDVVYGTTAEFGFDYLRDNMKRSVDQQVQRTREFAIVDEVDSILIDEARTPLIISGQAHEDAPRYELADRMARHLAEKQKPWAEADQAVEQATMRVKGIEGDIRNTRDKGAIPAMQEEMRRLKASLPGLTAARDAHTRYFEVELDRKQAHVTHQGVIEAQRVAGVGSFYVGDNIDLPHLLSQAIRAHAVYQRDRDYIVTPMPDPRTGKEVPSVVIVDTFTGRPMVGRQWSDGLHQAVEAKEGVPVKEETQTVATITIQNFFKMYKRLAGMTGTADTEAQEFHDIYKLDVVAIPTNLPVVRRDFDDTVYLTGKDKWSSIVDEIKDFHDVGRPVLVGTTSVEKSETLSEALAKRHGVRHEVLNAKQHEREAHIIENAGQLGAVMIATNMAGRGTDIKLARVTREQLLDHWVRRSLAPKELTTSATDEEVREKVYRKIAPKELEKPRSETDAMPFAELELALLRQWTIANTWVAEDAAAKMGAEELRAALDKEGRFGLHRIGWVDTVEGLGGLHVIGTERHESRRIDNQLRGRSGRQGDRGSSRFFVGLDDDLMKMFAGETTMRLLSKLGMKEGDSIEHPMLSRSVERAQRKVEERNFQIRKNILEYDEVMEHQRQAFYGTRQRVLEGRDLPGLVTDFIDDAVGSAAEKYLDPDYPAECAAEFARQAMECSIPPDALRGREGDEMILRTRQIARQEARHTIDVTIGEYLVEGAESADTDLQGLCAWAAQQFGVEMTPEEAGRLSRQEIVDRLYEAAVAKIDGADLTGIERYTEAAYGAGELCRWARGMFGVEVSPDEVSGAPEKVAGAAALIRDRALGAYRNKEIEYPVNFAMEMASAMMGHSPQAALGNLASWARSRFGLEWTSESIMERPPQDTRDALLEASRRAHEEQRREALLAEAAACADGVALERFFADRLGAPTPPALLELRDAEQRAALVAARVDSIARGEMTRFEQFVLLEVMDPLWKDHLYAMDQLRDSINYRAFSQQDPRIEYKREGSKIFKEMQKTLRERAVEYLFRVQLMPQLPPPPPAPHIGPDRGAPSAAGPGERPAPAPAGAVRRPGAVRFGSGTISGPGLDPPPAPPTPSAAEAPPLPASERSQREIDSALRAGSGGASESAADAGQKDADGRPKSYKRRK